MKSVTIIHNPRCSKSRETFKLIEAHGYVPKTINYLNGELTKELLEEVVDLLNVSAKELLRTKEEEFKTLKINLDDRNEVIAAILKQPILLERPIVIKDKKAVIGRPPENVLTLFES